MNELQNDLVTMVNELVEAMRKYPYRPEEIDEIFIALPGISDGSFFELSLDKQRHSLGWVNGAFFGRGERAIPLFKEKLLREDFDLEFNRQIKSYLHPSK
jgi:hypothetical protein